MSLTGAIVATAVGVLLPVILSTSVGIVALALGKGTDWTIFGVLVISFAAAATGGAVVVTVLLSRRNRLARQQADFIANVTHELRTPLTAIRMYAETIQMGRLDNNPELCRASVETILRETEWLEAMIDQVLTWRAASKDMDRPDMQERMLKETVGVAVERFRRMFLPGDVQFEAELNSVRKVFHDERAVESIVLNLLVNAYKYTGADKQIIIRLDDVENGVRLSVKDNGMGISPAEQEKIFEPFYRVDSRLSGKASGGGLGLAIVKHHAALHGTTVHVESVEGRGATFAVQFPGH